MVYNATNTIGKYCFKGCVSGWAMINYKINEPDYTLEIRSFDNYMVFIISFYDNLPKFIMCFSDSGCYFKIEHLGENIDINYDYLCAGNKKTLELPEFSKIFHTSKSNISIRGCYSDTNIYILGEELMARLLNKLDGSGKSIPYIDDVIDFLQEPKELSNAQYIGKILEVVNEQDEINWHIIFNHFIKRTRTPELCLYLPMIIV